MSEFAKKAKEMISDIEQDERFKQAAAATKIAAELAATRAQEASKNVSRKVAQEDAWEEMRGAAEQLTEIARAHHALLVDLIDRVGALEARAGITSRPEPDR